MYFPQKIEKDRPGLRECKETKWRFYTPATRRRLSLIIRLHIRVIFPDSRSSDSPGSSLN